MSSNPFTFDTIVVGGGLVGCAVAYYLTEQGVTDVLLLEADVHGAGATGGSFGNVRQQYGTALEVECSRRGLQFWKTVEDKLGSPCTFHQDGYLMVTAEPETADLLHRHAQVQRDGGMPDIQLLDAEQIRDVAPFLQADDLLCGSYTPLDGHVMGMDGIAAYSKAARAAGARVQQHTPVTAIVRGDGGWHVNTPAGTYVAARVIVAAGAGTKELLQPFGIDLDIRTVSHFSVITETAYPGQLLPFTVDLDNGLAVEREGQSLVLAMLGRNPAPRDHEDLIGKIFDAAAKRAPALQELSIAHKMTAWPTIGGDGHPYVGAVEDGLWALAFVGHGIMHGPPLAEAVVKAALGTPDDTLDLSAWDLRRVPGERSVLWRRKATS